MCIFLHEVSTTLVSILAPGQNRLPDTFNTKTEQARSVYQKHVLMLKGYLDIW